MKIILVLLILATSALAQFHPEYVAFLQKYGKWNQLSYEDKLRRQGNYFRNKKFMEEENQKNSSYILEITEHADRDIDRFVESRCKLDNTMMDSRALPAEPAFRDLNPAPPSVDWSKYGRVVSHQRGCGSCWAFATVALLEYFHILRGNMVPDLSQQHLVDCSVGDHGCNGGWPAQTLIYIRDNLNLEVANRYHYPYTSGITKTAGECKANSTATVKMGFSKVRQIRLYDDEEKLKQIIANFGPVILGMHISKNPAVSLYGKGIFKDDQCPTVDICNYMNHAVLAVGYGTDQETGLDYWIIRNSWGPDWGENGYVRWVRNQNNNCGIACVAMFVEP